MVCQYTQTKNVDDKKIKKISSEKQGKDNVLS
jgi:hypothetical protein